MTEENRIDEDSPSKAHMTMPKDFKMNMDIWQTHPVDENECPSPGRSSMNVSEVNGLYAPKPNNVFKESSCA